MTVRPRRSTVRGVDVRRRRLRPSIPVRVWAALLAGGCVEQFSLHTEPFASGLLVVQPPGGEREVHAVQGPNLPSIRVPDGTRLTLLGYPYSLSELGLERGPVEHDAPHGRPLPTVRSRRRLIAPSPTWEWLEPSDVLEEERSLSLPPLRECSGARVCRLRYAGRFICQKPCPSPQVAAPEPPIGPAAPSIRHCPPAWVSRGACIPPEDQSCPKGQLSSFDGGGCEPLLACPSSTFRGYPGPVERVRFVRAGASPGGMGSMEAPYASVAEALAAEGEGPLVLELAAGRYPVPDALPDALTLFGACPEQVELTSSIRVGAGRTLRLEGIHASASVEVLGTLHARDVDLRGPREALSLEASATAHLERAVLAAPAYGVFTRDDSGARLRARDVRIESDVGMRLSGTASVSLERVQVASRTRAAELSFEAAVDWTWGRVSAAEDTSAVLGSMDARLAARGLAVDAPRAFRFEDRARATLAGVVQQRAVAGVRCAGSSEISVEDFVQTATVAEGAVVAEEGCAIELRRAYALGGGGVFAHAKGKSRVQLSDIEVSGFDVGARAWGSAELTIDRGISPPVEAGATESGAYPGTARHPDFCTYPAAPPAGGSARLVLRDLSIQAGLDQVGLGVCAHVATEGARLRIRGGAVGVSITGRRGGINAVDRGQAMLTDIEVIPDSDTWIAFSATASDIDLRSYESEGALAYGMALIGSRAQLADIRVSSVAPPRIPELGDARLAFCTETDGFALRSPSTGIFVEGLLDEHTPLNGVPSVVELRGFRLADSTCSGFAVGAGATFSLSDGELEDNFIGLGVLRFSDSTVASDVHFLGTTQNHIYDPGDTL